MVVVLSLCHKVMYYLRVFPLERVTVVIFPSGSHAVGRSGTSLSGARAEFTLGNKGQQSSAKAALRHQHSNILLSPCHSSTSVLVALLSVSHKLWKITVDSLAPWRKASKQRIIQHFYYTVHLDVIKLHWLMIHWNDKKNPSPIQTELFMSGIRNCLNIWLWDVWVAQLDIHCKKSPLFKVWSGLQIWLWSQWLHIFTSIFSWKVQIFLKVFKILLFDWCQLDEIGSSSKSAQIETTPEKRSFILNFCRLCVIVLLFMSSYCFFLPSVCVLFVCVCVCAAEFKS